jgi:hypothetical protein
MPPWRASALFSMSNANRDPGRLNPPDSSDSDDFLNAIDNMEREEKAAKTAALNSPMGESAAEKEPPVEPHFVQAEDKERPAAISSNQLLVLGLAAIIIIVGLSYRLFSRPNIKLMSPYQNLALTADVLEFDWLCDKPDASLVIEVYDAGELVMRQIVKENTYRYKPEIVQLEAFQAGHSYHWYIISNPDVEQKYSIKSEERHFRITKAIEKPPEQPAPPPSPQPESKPPPPPPPPSNSNSGRPRYL